MSWSKRQFVLAAFEEIGMSNDNYNLSTTQLSTALKRLDAMMATWNGKGVRLSYPLPSNPDDSNLDSDTTVPDFANEAIYLNLAVRIAPSFGKVVSNEMKVDAKRAYRDMLSHNAYPMQERQLDSLPKGAGHKTTNFGSSQFFTPEDSYLDVGSDGSLVLE